MLPGVIDQNSSDRLCPDREKVRPPLPIDARLVDQFQIGLVNEVGGLEGVIGLRSRRR